MFATMTGNARGASHGLESEQYAEHGVFGRGQTAASVLLPSFAVSVDAVFDAD